MEHLSFGTLPGYTQYEDRRHVQQSRTAKAGVPAGERYALAWSVEEKPRDENILWYDLNADGIVDDQDFTILRNNLTTERKVAAGVSHRRHQRGRHHR